MDYQKEREYMNEREMEEELEKLWNKEHGVMPQEFKRVVINGEVIAGEDVERVYTPDADLVWRIVLKNGTLIKATGNISVETRDAKEE